MCEAGQTGAVRRARVVKVGYGQDKLQAEACDEQDARGYQGTLEAKKTRSEAVYKTTNRRNARGGRVEMGHAAKQ